MIELPSFPADRGGAAARALLGQLARRQLTTHSASLEDRSKLNAHVAALALEAGFVAEQADFYLGDVDALFARRTPFLLVPVVSEEATDVFASARLASHEAYAGVSDGAVVRFADAAGEMVSLPRRTAQELLRARLSRRIHHFAAHLRARVSALRGNASLDSALIRELGAGRPVAWGFVFRPNAAESVAGIMKSLSFGREATRFLVLSIVQSVLSLASWAVIGSLALNGHAERGSVLGWALLALSGVCVQVYTVRAVGRFTVRAATLVRQRLLEGALRLDPDGLGDLGLGGLMVVAAQADSFPNAALALFLAAIGVVTNVIATVAVLSVAPMATLYLALFAAAAVLALALAPRLFQLQRRQQSERMRLTTEMVERMLGHRTRLVQQTPGSWHEGEDESLVTYGRSSRRLDRLVAFLHTLPRLYYGASLAGVFVVLVAHPTHQTLALSLGGLALGSIALSALVDLLVASGSLLSLWRTIRPVIRDDTGVRMTSGAASDIADGAEEVAGPIVELRGVRFHYPGRSKPLFEDAHLRVLEGERVLVEGRSGGGKTTLAALLTGLRKPNAGLVFVRGLDQHTIGERDLRAVVASAPQFYKNHVFTESLAFNMLLGRAWPPSREDLADATRVATDLGLGDLLARMPAGVFQHVGETGWQLSHGERSRVFLARALLQRSQLLILDESFGALDPKTLLQCMTTVLERARSLVVITHR